MVCVNVVSFPREKEAKCRDSHDTDNDGFPRGTSLHTTPRLRRQAHTAPQRVGRAEQMTQHRQAGRQYQAAANRIVPSVE